MKRLALLLFTLFGTLYASASEVDSLFHKLDETLAQSEYYVQKRQQRIDVIKKKKELTTLPEEQYQINYDLANLYLGFQYDSAYVYSLKCMEIAAMLPTEEPRQKAAIHYANVLSSAGLFLEAKEVLDRMNTLLPSLSYSYYSACERLYANLCDYHGNSGFVPLYGARLKEACRVAFQSLSANDPLYYLYSFRDFEADSQWEKALDMAVKYATLTEGDSQPHAVALGCMADAYSHLGDKEKQKECLILSAISDIASATKENASMLQLSILLFHEGEVNRAHRYIKVALEDANFYNARFRNLQISKTLPIIEAAYQQTATAYKQKLLFCLACITLLCLFLVFIAMKLRRKTTRLTHLQQQLTLQNKELTHFTEEQKKLVLLQSALNKEIEDRNRELSQLTGKYKEANRAKEEYIGHFLQMCSIYISKLNDYRKTINRKLMAGQYQDLVVFTSSQKHILTERHELYRQFDIAFLHLYPGFVKQLNELLLPDEQIEFKNGEGLGNELRIFALLRLGVTDSSQIADFLGYTLPTIYTYRTKMRNRAKDRDNFESDILRIG